jgi:O-antigen ligase
MKNLVSHFSMDERIQWWADAWKMQKDNSLFAWIVGNGIGSVRESSPKYLDSRWGIFIFPHNHFLEILYDNGIVGFVLIFGGLGYIFFYIIKKTRDVIGKNMSILMKCMIILFLIWFIHCGLVFPFYSNYSMYPLGFILGTMLLLMERIPRDGVVQQAN